MRDVAHAHDNSAAETLAILYVELRRGCPTAQTAPREQRRVESDRGGTLFEDAARPGRRSAAARARVPGAAGNTIDILGRLIGQWLSERLGQPFVIDNRPGAGTNIGTEAWHGASREGFTGRLHHSDKRQQLCYQSRLLRQGPI